MDNYTTDQYGSVYKWSQTHRAWIFIGKLNGKSLKAFLNEMYDEA